MSDGNDLRSCLVAGQRLYFPEDGIDIASQLTIGVVGEPTDKIVAVGQPVGVHAIPCHVVGAAKTNTRLAAGGSRRRPRPNVECRPADETLDSPSGAFRFQAVGI